MINNIIRYKRIYDEHGFKGIINKILIKLKLREKHDYLISESRPQTMNWLLLKPKKTL